MADRSEGGKATRQDIAQAMRDMDIAMMSTHADRGIATRPMSNNRDVDFDGTSHFFTRASSNVARQIAADPRVALGYAGEGLLEQVGELSLDVVSH